MGDLRVGAFVVGAVTRGAAFQADGHARGGEQVVDVAEALGQRVRGDERFQFGLHLGARQADRRGGPSEFAADLIDEFEGVGSVQPEAG